MISSKALRWLSCGIAIACLVGCDSSSTAHLNESSGKSMLVAKMAADQKDKYLLSFAGIPYTLKQLTRNDYSQGSYPESLPAFMGSRIANPQAVIQRLLKAGYVSQSKTTFTVPDVSGNYEAELSWLWGGSYHMKATYALTISMKPADNSISGHYHEESTGGGAQYANGPLAGSVDADGIVHLSWSGKNLAYSFNFTNGEKRLTGKQPFVGGPDVTLVGHGPGGEITVPVYSYALSSGFETLPPPHQDEIQAGKIEIDQITNLLLSSDTMAQAAFGWQVDFNRAAKALSGQDKASGTGSVIFVKQPDGNWVITGYGL
jgi:hypothetical protein